MERAARLVGRTRPFQCDVGPNDLDDIVTKTNFLKQALWNEVSHRIRGEERACYASTSTCPPQFRRLSLMN